MASITVQVMEIGSENNTKRTVDNLSSDSTDSAPQSPVFKKACKTQESVKSQSMLTSPVRITRSHSLGALGSLKGPVKIVSVSREQVIASLVRKKGNDDITTDKKISSSGKPDKVIAPPPATHLEKSDVTVESLSLQIAALAKSMEDFKSVFKKDNNRSTEELKKSIKDIAVIIPRVNVLEKSVKDLNQIVSNPSDGLKTKVRKLESDIKILHGYDVSVRKVQEGFKGIEPRIQKLEKFVKSSKAAATKAPSNSSSSMPPSSVQLNEITDIQSDDADLRTTYSTKFDIVSGYLEKLHRQQLSTQSQVEFNLSKNMQNELRLGGVPETRRENCKLKAIDFLKSKVKVTLDN